MNCDSSAFPNTGCELERPGLSKLEWAAIRIAAALIAAGHKPADVETLAVSTAQKIIENAQP